MVESDILCRAFFIGIWSSAPLGTDPVRRQGFRLARHRQAYPVASPMGLRL